MFGFIMSLTLAPMISYSANLQMYLSKLDTSSNQWESPKIINAPIFPSAAASIAYNGSNFGIAYVQAMSTNIFVQYGTVDGSKWEDPINVPYTIANSEASIAFYKGLTYVTYYDSSYTVWIVSSDDGKTWSKPQNMSLVVSGINAQAPPFLYVWNNYLYLFVTAKQVAYIGQLQLYTRFDGTDWSPMHYLGTSGNVHAYQMAAVYDDSNNGVNNVLFCTMLGSGGSNMYIIVIDEYGVIDYMTIPSTTSKSIAAAVFNEKLNLYFKGAGSNYIYTMSFNETQWSKLERVSDINGQNTNFAPHVVMVDKMMYLLTAYAS
eukprot:290688_1